jgi:dienelactone hydrolase
MKNSLEKNTEDTVEIPSGNVALEGNLTVPTGAAAVVLFAHGSGSSRHSPRNRYVADKFHQAGLATLLFDLLSADEEDFDIRTTRLRFDIALLTERLLSATDWVHENSSLKGFKIGCFGASTGAGAALVAAAEKPELVAAVVSRGGRPDLAGSSLARVRCPTLLIVGGNDQSVIELNRQAMEMMKSDTKLEIIPRATHLFEEPGALDAVSALAANWFEMHLAVS